MECILSTQMLELTAFTVIYFSFLATFVFPPQ